MVSFSGELIDPDLGGAFTKVDVNQGIKEKQRSEKFAGDWLGPPWSWPNLFLVLGPAA